MKLADMKAERGFTLIETLIALVVAATAAAVILGQLRVMVVRVEQERSHELAVLRVLNDAARLSLGSPGTGQPEREDANSLRIRYQDPSWPVVTVRNFSASGRKLPPLQLAFTPFQLYSVSEGSYVLSVVAPGIRRPDAIAPKIPPSPAGTAAAPLTTHKPSVRPRP